MCLIVQGKVKDILRLDLKSAWNCNPHGAGIVIPNKMPIAIKGLMSYENFLSRLRKISASKNVVVHFRYATHGKVNIANSHPHFVDRTSWLVHNGVINGLGASGANGRSDSAHLANILGRLAIADRLALLDSYSSNQRFILVTGKQIDVFGNFTDQCGVLLSNTYWQVRPSAPSTTMGFNRGDYYLDCFKYADLDN
jgi:hypothetical protein